MPGSRLISVLFDSESLSVHNPEDALLTFDVNPQLLQVPEQKTGLHSKHSDVLHSASDSLQVFVFFFFAVLILNFSCFLKQKSSGWTNAVADLPLKAIELWK